MLSGVVVRFRNPVSPNHSSPPAQRDYLHQYDLSRKKVLRRIFEEAPDWVKRYRRDLASILGLSEPDCLTELRLAVPLDWDMPGCFDGYSVVSFFSDWKARVSGGERVWELEGGPGETLLLRRGPKVLISASHCLLANWRKGSLRRLRKFMHFPVRQLSEEWFSLRRGRVTASVCAAAAGRDRFKDKEELLSRVRLEDSGGRAPRGQANEAMRKGIENEPRAREEYERWSKAECRVPGFLIPHFDWRLGCSPDAMARGPCKPTSGEAHTPTVCVRGGTSTHLVEIKCPRYVYDSAHAGRLFENHMCQVQMQMAATGVRETAFCVFGHEEDELVVVRVPFHKTFWESLYAQIRETLSRVGLRDPGRAA